MTKDIGSTEEDQRALHLFWSVYEQNVAAVLRAAQGVAERTPALARLMGGADDLERELLSLQRAALLEHDFAPYLAALHARGMEAARLGIAVRVWSEVLAAAQGALIADAVKRYGRDAASLRDALAGMTRFAAITLAALMEAYVAAQENELRREREAARQLSVPLVRLSGRAMLVPLTGPIDSTRGESVAMDLLLRVAAAEAYVVVVDLTGVPAVDASARRALQQSIQSLRLMGTEVVLIGPPAEALAALTGGTRRVLVVPDLEAALRCIGGTHQPPFTSNTPEVS